MHAQQFVSEMIATGRKDELVKMIDDFSDRLHQQKTKEHAIVYGFANMFLLSVGGQLRALDEGKDLEDDKFLSAWKSLGLFGIDRAEIDGVLNSNE